jgi:arylsulfatase A-like enzyme
MSTRPNVIVIITDDQGYGDLSCMGSTDLKTPHLDQLAADGVRCTSWYAGSSVCSPSRACLLSGRYPGNAGVRSILAGHRTASGLPTSVPTLPSVLGKAGYATFMSGKWHLGVTPNCRPKAHGFQRSFGFLAGCVDFFSHIFYWGMNQPGPGVNPTHDLWQDDQEVWRCGEYLTDVISNKAVESIRDAHAAGKPFFGYVAYNAPHYPMHAPMHYQERFAHLPWDRRIMAAMIAAVDDGVGAIRAELTKLGIADNTLIVFTSDNGPSRESRNWLDGTLDPYYGGTTDGLRGHKFSLFEGGIRVPGIVTFPGRIPAGQVCDAPLGSVDVLPTVLAACGIDANHMELDGQDISELLAGKTSAPTRDQFWELGPQTAVRRGPWKLTLQPREVESAQPVAECFLANLDSDRSERVNLAEQEPALAAELRQAAETWRAGIEARWERDFANGKANGLTAL